MSTPCLGTSPSWGPNVVDNEYDIEHVAVQSLVQSKDVSTSHNSGISAQIPDQVKLFLVAADIPYTMQETKCHLHAQEIAHSLDVLKYDRIVCVSGEGVLVEVVNGLLQREDWDTTIKVPHGINPASSGNGMVKSLLDSVGEMKFFSILMLTWGLFADIDIESEKYRWMSSARFDLYSLLRVMNLRRYHGGVQFVPAPRYESYGEPINQDSNCMGNTIVFEQGQVNNIKAQSCGYPGPVASLDGLEWRSIDGPFVSVWIINVPWACKDFMPAPEAKFSIAAAESGTCCYYLFCCYPVWLLSQNPYSKFLLC